MEIDGKSHSLLINTEVAIDVQQNGCNWLFNTDFARFSHVRLKFLAHSCILVHIRLIFIVCKNKQIKLSLSVCISNYWYNAKTLKCRQSEAMIDVIINTVQ